MLNRLKTVAKKTPTHQRIFLATYKLDRLPPRAYLSKLGDNAKNGLLVNLRSEMSPNATRRTEDSKTIRFRNCIITASCNRLGASREKRRLENEDIFQI